MPTPVEQLLWLALGFAPAVLLYAETRIPLRPFYDPVETLMREVRMLSVPEMMKLIREPETDPWCNERSPL